MADPLIIEADFFPKHPKVIKISNRIILDEILSQLEWKIVHMKTLNFTADSFCSIVTVGPIEVTIDETQNNLDFYGEIVDSTGDALESAYAATIEGLKSANNLIIQDYSYAQLDQTNKKLQQALSWSDLFQHSCIHLKDTIAKAKLQTNDAGGSVLAISGANVPPGSI